MTPGIDAPPAPRIHFLTLGCPKNEVDSDRMSAVAVRAGLEVTAQLDTADVVVLNTCGFIRDAVQESIDTALELADWRDASHGRFLVMVGCLVSRYGDELTGSLTEPDAFIPVADEHMLPSVVEDLTGWSPVATEGPVRLDRGPSAYLQVSDGCHRACAYCTIPSIRGPYRSRPLDEIVDEARLLTSRGAREIVLIGQDISAYGRDLSGAGTLPDVIRGVAAVPGVDWLRLMYVQPDGVTAELIETMAAEPKVCRYLDIPLQHASTRVLRAMRRRGSAEEFLGMIGRLREAMPDIVLRTTLIAGFPGEKRADIAELEQFIPQAAFDYVGVFPYSPEEGTAAATLPELPDRRTRVRRAQRLRDVADEVGIEKAARRIGSILEVLSEGLDSDGVPVGRWRGQAPEIDGLVLLDRVVTSGTFVCVRITDTAGYDLEGEVLE